MLRLAGGDLGDAVRQAHRRRDVQYRVGLERSAVEQPGADLAFELSRRP
jgi:hypothetical protein